MMGTCGRPVSTLIRVPLMIFEPGRQAGLDIYARTSGIDVLPTLAHLTATPYRIVRGFRAASFSSERRTQSGRCLCGVRQEQPRRPVDSSLDGHRARQLQVVMVLWICRSGYR